MISTHLTLSSGYRKLIEGGKIFKEIGKILGKDCTTISKEVRRHRVERKTGAFTIVHAWARIGCHKRSLCKKRSLRKRIRHMQTVQWPRDAFVEQKCDASKTALRM